MYEIEKKIEISKEEKQVIIAKLLERHFIPQGTVPQNDYYIHAVVSEHGGYDTKRLRKEGEDYLSAEKSWVLVEGQKTRKEEEVTLDQKTFEAMVANSPNAIKIIKDRESFSGTIDGEDGTVVFDKVQFDHSPHSRYFLEAEILVSDKALVAATKEKITKFLAEISGRSLPLDEAPGMFTMAYDKL